MIRRFALAAAAALTLHAQTAHDAVPDLAIGRRIFDSQCSLCHGQNGTGGRGPALNRPTLNKAPDDEALRKAISDGLPPEMPGAWQLSVRETASVAAFVRSLGTVAPEAVPGNAARGRTLFESRGCGGCHVVAGSGTPSGPELTAVGARRNAAHLRESLVRPAAHLPDGYLLVDAVTAAGRTVSGLKVNEDPFTIQVRDVLSGYHSLRKSGLRQLRRRTGESAMPPYDKLPASELDDLVAYLAGLR